MQGIVANFTAEFTDFTAKNALMVIGMQATALAVPSAGGRHAACAERAVE